MFWLEEPFEPDEYEAYAELADAVDIRVAAGEQDTTLWGFRELIERGHVDLVQPDVTRCGGITELLRIAEFAHERGVETVPHAWKSGIIKAASLHVNAVLPDALFQEYCVADTPINTSLTKRAPADRRRRVRRRADRARARHRARRGGARPLPGRLGRSEEMASIDEQTRQAAELADARGPRDPGRRQQRPAPRARARGPRRHRDERLDLHRRERAAPTPTTTPPSGRRSSGTTTPTSTPRSPRPRAPSA